MTANAELTIEPHSIDTLCPAGQTEFLAKDFHLDGHPIEPLPEYTIARVDEWYDGPRRAHRQRFFHVLCDGKFVKSYKRQDRADNFIAKQLAKATARAEKRRATSRSAGRILKLVV